jgi:Domain of unknown function (DUF6881)
MKYVRLKWNHTNPDEPVWIFSELNMMGNEVRKIECFRSGFCDVATATASSGTARLMTLPLPDLSLLARRDPEFEPVVISKEEFEEVWVKRQYKAI